MRFGKHSAWLCLSAALASCGGGGGGGGGSSGPITATPTPSPTPTPTPTTAGCSLRERQDWAGAQIREWYLFPDLLPTGVSPASYSTVDDYIDALTATARAQQKDRYFTYITSIAAENAFYASGDSAGFGVRLSVDTAARRLFIIEAFENAPALTAGLDRGTEILAIGDSASTLRTVDSILASEGTAGLDAALGPATAGVTRHLRVSTGGTTRELAVTKATYSIDPVSDRYGSKTFTDAGTTVGYVNLRTFITPANEQLRTAIDGFRAQGITRVIVDLRYNGGGLVSTAELLNNLLAGNRTSSNVMSYTTFNASKAAYNETTNFSPQAQSMSPMKIAFIGTRGSASASELVMNTFTPYLGANNALIGTNTYGKPVGQIAVDRSACDDRLRVVAFKTENSSRQGDYYTGLAQFMGASCQAGDDISRPLGDSSETSIKTALDFLAGRGCTAISGGITTQAARGRDLVQPRRPSTAQREVPGSY